MGLQSKHRAYAALVALAGAALVVDKVFLGGGATGPAQATARQAPPDRPERRAAERPAAPSYSAAPAEASRRLAALDLPGDGGFGDAFAVPSGWPAPAAPATSVADVQAPDEAHADPVVRLTAVMTSGRPAARVDGRLILVGGRTPEGLELVEVRERSARFRTPSGRIITVDLRGPADQPEDGPRSEPDGTAPTRGGGG